MNTVRKTDLSVGLFILAGLLALLILALQVSGLSPLQLTGGFTVTADFDNIGDLKVRAPVTIAGVRIGQVAAIDLDPQTLKAKVRLKINASQSKIPDNVNARILTQGLLGTNYIELTPGYDEGLPRHYLAQGTTISETQPALILENIIGQLLFNVSKKTHKE